MATIVVVKEADKTSTKLRLLITKCPNKRMTSYFDFPCITLHGLLCMHEKVELLIRFSLRKNYWSFPTMMFVTK